MKKQIMHVQKETAQYEPTKATIMRTLKLSTSRTRIKM